ncbi:hypothetical protein SAMN02910289_01535 [Lachnospiraceae bacterium RM5]|nr:hypothetical protein SAMN02910289_01535 [Lachnospiraceae bacterium RM5]
MASLKCSKCGEGIHYHSLPQNIEYIYFSKMAWKKVCNTRFDKNNKDMDESGKYPKLYRSSTIENDYSGEFLKIWKCPVCGTLHFFDNKINVKKVFVKNDNVDIVGYTEIGVMFADYLWDDITEQDISNDMLSSIEPSFYVGSFLNYLVISKTEDFSDIECYKLYLADWMK